MSHHRAPIDLSTSRSHGLFEARFRVWGNHDEQTDGPIVLADAEMPPARTLFMSDRHGITVRLNDMQPAASPGGTVILSAEGPTEGRKRVADMDPTRQAKMGLMAALMINHTETVLGDRELLDQVGMPADTTLAYAGSMNANAAVWSPHSNTLPVYAPTGRTSWMLATGTAPDELRTPLKSDKLLVIQNALVVPEAVSAGFEAALDEVGKPEAIVSIAREHYLEHLARIAASESLITAQ